MSRGPGQHHVDQQVAVANDRLVRLAKRPRDTKGFSPLPHRQRLAVATGPGPRLSVPYPCLAHSVFNDAQSTSGRGCRETRAGSLHRSNPEFARTTPAADCPRRRPRRSDRHREETASTHHWERGRQDFREGPVQKSLSRRVLEGDPGNVDTADLERHRHGTPGSKEGNIRCPVAPCIGGLPMPSPYQA